MRRAARPPAGRGATGKRMIEFTEVSKSFWTGQQRKVILDRASFRVRLGHSLGVLAANGTGKTTLINMMAGLEKPDEGDIRRSCRISPSSGFSSPAIMLMIVVLPVPFCARMPIDWPGSTAKLARSRITLRCVPVQNDLLTLVNCSAMPEIALPDPSRLRDHR